MKTQGPGTVRETSSGQLIAFQGIGLHNRTSRWEAAMTGVEDDGSRDCHSRVER